MSVLGKKPFITALIEDATTSDDDLSNNGNKVIDTLRGLLDNFGTPTHYTLSSLWDVANSGNFCRYSYVDLDKATTITGFAVGTDMHLCVLVPVVGDEEIVIYNIKGKYEYEVINESLDINELRRELSGITGTSGGGSGGGNVFPNGVEITGPCASSGFVSGLMFKQYDNFEGFYITFAKSSGAEMGAIGYVETDEGAGNGIMIYDEANGLMGSLASFFGKKLYKHTVSFYEYGGSASNYHMIFVYTTKSTAFKNMTEIASDSSLSIRWENGNANCFISSDNYPALCRISSSGADVSLVKIGFLAGSQRLVFISDKIVEL